MGKYPYFPKVKSTWNKKQKFDSISIKEITTPDNPDSDYEKLYFKADGKLYKLNSSGTEAVAVEGISTAQANAIIANTAKISLDDNSVTTAKLAHGTANKYLGFDASGNPAELTVSAGGVDTGAWFLNNIDELPASPVLDYSFTLGRRTYFVTQISPYLIFRDSRESGIKSVYDDFTSYSTDAQIDAKFTTLKASHSGNHTDNRIDASGNTTDGDWTGHTGGGLKCMYDISGKDIVSAGFDMKFRINWTGTNLGTTPYTNRYYTYYIGAVNSSGTVTGLMMMNGVQSSKRKLQFNGQDIITTTNIADFMNTDYYCHIYSNGVNMTCKLYSNSAMTTQVGVTVTMGANTTTEWRGFGAYAFSYSSGTNAYWNGNWTPISMSIGGSDY
jgi:hypothetical protein